MPIKNRLSALKNQFKTCRRLMLALATSIALLWLPTLNAQEESDDGAGVVPIILSFLNNDRPTPDGGPPNQSQCPEVTDETTLSRNFTINTQEDVNQLIGITKIGVLSIPSSIISSLDVTPLNSLVEVINLTIDGSRDQTGNALILPNFDCLTEISNELRITGNQTLRTVVGFPELTRVGGDFRFQGNPILELIDGFNKLKEVGGSFNLSVAIDGSIDGFFELESVGGFSIGAGASRIGEFPQLRNAGVSLQIFNLLNLMEVGGFPALVDVDNINVIGAADNFNCNDLAQLVPLIGRFTGSPMFCFSPL